MEGQVDAFRKAGLEFQLIEELLHEAEIVAFRGRLRLEGTERRATALVIYPPGFHLGEHPTVIAPNLDVGRHRSPTGSLCLDHAEPGARQPMSGAEAVLRAERLWWLWENDRKQLDAEEADVAEPWADYIHYEPNSAVAFGDLELPADAQSGVIELGLSSVQPLRGAVRTVRALKPSIARADARPVARVLGGDIELRGPWKRLKKHPPLFEPHQACDWILLQHGEMLRDGALEIRVPDSDLPYLLAFVYPDEGPGRNETHDAWLFVAIRPDGKFELPRPIAIGRAEAGGRQPEMSGLGSKRVAIVGLGALGSQIATLLARSGVESFSLIDSDLFMPGNEIRHDLDLSAVGQDKVAAIRERILRLSPWAQVDANTSRLGTLLVDASFSALQYAHDALADRLATADLIVNATAEPGAGSWISAISAASRTPALHTWVGAGAWGSRILVQTAGSACTDCLGEWQRRASDPPPEPIPPLCEPRSPAVPQLGCAHASFTGPGFELASTAAAAARVAVQELLGGDGYPRRDFDLATTRFRDRTTALPTTTYTALPPHPACDTCRGRGAEV